MPATQPQLSIANLKRMVKNPKMSQLLRTLDEAEITAKRVRADVDAYEKPIFDRFTFMVKPAYRERLRTSHPDGRITRIKDLYLTDDTPELAAFYAACLDAHRDHGYTGPPETCPALMAEHAVISAQNALLQYAEDSLGIPFRETYGEVRDQALKTLRKCSRP